MARTARTTAFVAATLLVTGALAAPSAGAAAPDDAASGTPSGTSARHCVVNSATGAESCFADFPDAIEAATGGQVTDTPASAKAAAGDQAFRTEMKRFNAPTQSTSKSAKSAKSSTLAAAGSVVQGTFFDEVQFGGSSLTITGTAPCVKDGWIEYQYDFPDDWKNRVSSVQPWADCWIWLYPEPNLTGDRDGPFDENTADVGSFMNDRAQSVGFS